MPSGSETIIVIPALTDPEKDRDGDPIEGATPAEPREIRGCVLIPRFNPEDETTIIDGYQVAMMDPSQTPPEPEDRIKIRGRDKQWFIDQNVGDFTKPSGQLKAYIFVIKSVR